MSKDQWPWRPRRSRSRVQTLNKEYGTTILITQSTYEEVKDEFACRPMGEKPLRGKSRMITLYEVISTKAALESSAAATGD